MKQYIKDGKIQPANKIVLIKDGFQHINPTEELILADGWVEYVDPEPTEYELFVQAKQEAKMAVESYDSSTEVNSFYIDGNRVWLDKATRAGLMLRFQAEIAMGGESTTLWYEGRQFPLQLAVALQMLYALEIYASACYDNTQRHLATIDAIGTIDEIKAYDYTTGYPEKLEF